MRLVGYLYVLPLFFGGCSPKGDNEDTSKSSISRSDGNLGTNDQAQMPRPISDPSLPEATQALGQVFRASGHTFVLYPADTVRGCVDGRDASGGEVRVCNVCAVALTGLNVGLLLERSEFNVAFRRAISAQHAEITSADGSGVWVAATQPNRMAGFVEVPRTRSYFSRPLTTEDVRPLGMSMTGSGTICLPAPPDQLGFCVISNGAINALSSTQARDRMKEVAGSCG